MSDFSRPIAFVSTMEGAPWGGSEELWSRAAARLSEQGHHVMANVARWPDEPHALAAIRECGVKISKRPRECSLRHRVFKRLGKAAAWVWLQRTQPSLLVISQGGNLDGLAWMEAAAKLSVPFVTIAQMANESYWPPADVGARAAAVYPRAEKCFFVSEANRALTEMQIASRLPRAEIVRNPVNIPRAVTLPLPWPEESDAVTRFAAIGRLAPCAKGQDILFQVLAMPKWRARPVEVTLFGEGFFQAALERLAVMWNLGNVRFAGHIADIEQIWKSHHALLLPSRYEGLPLALVEAMLVGRVPIVTDVAGNAEVVTDGVTGFIAKAPNPACLDEAMERAWEARRRWAQMGAAAATSIRALIPQDPIADFLDRLPIRTSVSKAQSRLAGIEPLATDR